MISIRRALKLVSLTAVLVALIPTPLLRTSIEARSRSKKASLNRRDNAAKKTKREQKQTARNKRTRANRPRSTSSRRRARAAHRAAIARQRALDEALRNRVAVSIAGDDLTGEDLEVRRVALDALGHHAGTVVVMDAQTGRIYSIVNQEWALGEGFKPCSTIKLVTGLAGLSESVIDPTDTAKISSNKQVDLTRALAYSRNRYFQRVGGQVGFEKLVSYARLLGLGEKTGINVQSEFAGRLPVLEPRLALDRIFSHGDDFEVTAVQLATLAAAMSNGGKVLTPRIVRTREDEIKFQTKVRWQVDIDPDLWRYMVPGMVGAVNYGSGRRAYDPQQTVAGKTGTCIDDGRWVGLFTSYAPLFNPRLAVVVIARGSDARGHLPAAVAGRIYRDLNLRFGTAAGLDVATTRSVDADFDAEDNNENEEVLDSDTGIAESPAATSRKPWWSNSKVRQVLMPRPLKRDERATTPTSTPSKSKTQERPGE